MNAAVAALDEAPVLSSRDKPWLASYPAGVPAQIDSSVYGSLVDLLNEAFRKHAQRDAAICMGQRMRFSEIDQLSMQLGAWLQAQGLKQGDRVAIMMPNLLQYGVAIAAILRAGFVVVNVNPLYTPRELEHQLKDSGARAIVVLENFAHTLSEVINATDVKHVVLASMGDLLNWWKGPLINFAVRHLKKMVPEFRLQLMSKEGEGRTVVRFNEALAHGERLQLKRPELGPDDVAFLQYTGGTTGVSKGATLLHRNIVANILQSKPGSSPCWPNCQGRHAVHQCLRAAAVSHLRADGLLHARRAHGPPEHPDPNPRDIPGFIKTLSQAQDPHLPGRQHAVQCTGRRPELLAAGLLRARHLQRRRHGRAAGHGREVAGRSPAARSSRATACRRPRRSRPSTRRPARLQRQHRPADLLHRDRNPR
jgi:long-chain acyl-CoA synthetase